MKTMCTLVDEDQKLNKKSENGISCKKEMCRIVPPSSRRTGLSEYEEFKSMCKLVDNQNGKEKLDSSSKHHLKMLSEQQNVQDGIYAPRIMCEVTGEQLDEGPRSLINKMNEIKPVAQGKSTVSPYKNCGLTGGNVLGTCGKQVGNFFVTSDGRLTLNGREIMNCNVRINEVVSDEKRSTYCCSVFINDREIVKEIPAQLFTKGEWLRGIPGFATGNGVGDARRYIYEYLNELVRMSTGLLVEQVRKPGWIKYQGMYVYITPDGVIGNCNLRIKSEYGQRFEKVPQYSVGVFHDFITMIKLTPRTWTGTIILLYTVISFSYTFFKKARLLPKFILFLNGPRGSFKTQIALVMTQIERSDSPEYTLKAKQAALETGFKRYKDAVMLVDDLAPTQELSDRKFMQSNLELITRSFGDGTGKKRNYDFQKENFNVEQYEAEGGAIITGEYTTGCESSLSRAVFLPLKREDVDISLLTQMQENKGRLAAFMVGFIPFLGQNGEEIIVFIREEGKRYRNQLLRNYSNPRYAEYYAQLMVAAELLLYYGVYTKQIEKAEERSMLASWNEYIKAAIQYNDTLLRRESPIVQLCNAIIAGIEMEVFPIIRYGEAVSKELRKLVIESETSFFITQTDALELKEWYMNKNEIKTDKYSTTELARMLYEAGIISKVTEGETVRYARKISGYGNRRFMELCKEKLYQIAKGNYV